MSEHISGGRCRRLMVVAALVVVADAPLARASGQGQELSLHATQNKTSVSVSLDHRPLLEYRFGDVPFKPYVERLCSPAGVNVLRDAPPGHKHHHGLMFAVAVDGVDFWGETPACGSQVARPPEGIKTASGNGLAQGSFSQDLDWLAPDKTPLAQERRTIEVSNRVEGGATLLTWTTQLQPPPGKDSIRLGGSHYFGLGMRLVEAMDKVGRFFNAAGRQGEIVRGKEQLVRAAWCAYTAPVEGKPLTVVLFDDPGNPRHPAHMFTMAEPFAYLSATLNLWKEPLVVTAANPLHLRYGVAIFDGVAEREQIEKVYRRWGGGKQ